MTRAAYTGHETLTFMDYTDLGTGQTLTAEPGGVYDIAPSSGRPVTEVPPGWFVAVEEKKTVTATAGMQGSGEAATAPQPEDDEGGSTPDEQ